MLKEEDARIPKGSPDVVKNSTTGARQMESSRDKNHHSQCLSNQGEKNQHEPMNAFQVNAPIHDGEEQDKDQFYQTRE